MKNFIPKPYLKTPITVRISNEKLELIDEYCEMFKINRSEFINRSIDFSISNIQSKEFKKEHFNQIDK